MSKMGTAMSLVTPLRYETVTVPASWMQLMSNFAATWGRADGHALGIHCSRCGQDLIGGNSATDAVLKVNCGCREFVNERRVIG